MATHGEHVDVDHLSQLVYVPEILSTQVCCFLHTFIDIFLAVFTIQTKSHVVINSHVWVKA